MTGKGRRMTPNGASVYEKTAPLWGRLRGEWAPVHSEQQGCGGLLSVCPHAFFRPLARLGNPTIGPRGRSTRSPGARGGRQVTAHGLGPRDPEPRPRGAAGASGAEGSLTGGGGHRGRGGDDGSRPRGVSTAPRDWTSHGKRSDCAPRALTVRGWPGWWGPPWGLGAASACACAACCWFCVRIQSLTITFRG